MGRLTCIDINKIYPNGVHAVHDFNLNVDEGEFIVLVGPSGCGKSTVLRMVAGLEGISTGELLLDSRLINKVAPVDRDISIVFQDYALYGHMTVFDNVGMSLKVRHSPPEELFEKVIETADFLKIRSFLNRFPDQLSGGQKQRVSLGRAIARQPQVFLMDEPLSNLDAKLRTHTQTELVRIQRTLGVTTLYVTHDQREAMTMADRMVVMDNGVVQQIGSPTDIYSHPRNLFVAGFIGTPPMNFINGKIFDGRFVVDDVSFKLPDARKAALENYEDRQVVMGIRPEHFAVVNKPGDALLTLVVTAREFLGSCHHLYLAFGKQQLIANIGRLMQDDTDMISVTIDLDAVHFFDATTTERIGIVQGETA
jgi:multiple sugar transport system ATP-binding protein